MSAKLPFAVTPLLLVVVCNFIGCGSEITSDDNNLLGLQENTQETLQETANEQDATAYTDLMGHFRMPSQIMAMSDPYLNLSRKNTLTFTDRNNWVVYPGSDFDPLRVVATVPGTSSFAAAAMTGAVQNMGITGARSAGNPDGIGIAMMYMVPGSSGQYSPTVKYQGAASSWTYTFPWTTPNNSPQFFIKYAQGAAQSSAQNSDKFVAAILNPPLNRIDVAIFSSASSTPLRTFSTPAGGGDFVDAEISDDGRYVTIGRLQRFYLYDAQAGLQLWSNTIWNVLRDVAVNNDATKIAIAENSSVTVYQRSALTTTSATYVTYATLQGSSLTSYYGNVALSSEGNILATAENNVVTTNYYELVKFKAYNINNPTQPTLLMSNEFDGDPSLTNTSTDLAISRDGKRICATQTGDDNTTVNGSISGPVPEFVAYDLTLANPNIPVLARQGEEGSAMSVAMSNDGTLCAVGVKKMHAAIFGGGGTIRVYNIVPKDVEIIGTMWAGQTTQAQVYAAPGSTINFLCADSENPTNPRGSIRLGLTNRATIGSATADANGHAYFNLAVPPRGIRKFCQAVRIFNGTGDTTRVWSDDVTKVSGW